MPSNRLQIVARPDAPGAGPVAEIEIDPAFLERYQLGQELGRGGMGMVIAARQLASGEALAVKFLLQSGDDTATKRFEQEGRLLQRVRHPAVVRVHEVGAMSGHPYLVCEYLSGGTLKERLADSGPLPWREAVDLMAAVLHGLHACHLQGIVHRDLKPDNILFDAAGLPRLVDLGIAKAYGDLGSSMTRTGIILGTPAYMSPEQARGEPAGIASDIYAAGLVLYELLSGSPPFVAGSVVEVLHAHIAQPAPPLGERARNLPASLVALVHAALSKRIDERPASAEELAERLKRLKEEVPEGPRPTGRPGSAAARKRPAFAVESGTVSTMPVEVEHAQDTLMVSAGTPPSSGSPVGAAVPQQRAPQRSSRRTPVNVAAARPGAAAAPDLRLVVAVGALLVLAAFGAGEWRGRRTATVGAQKPKSSVASAAPVARRSPSATSGSPSPTVSAPAKPPPSAPVEAQTDVASSPRPSAPSLPAITKPPPPPASARPSPSAKVLPESPRPSAPPDLPKRQAPPSPDASHPAPSETPAQALARIRDLRNAGHFEEALTAASDAAALFPQVAAFTLVQAEMQAQQGHTQEALEIYHRALDAGPPAFDRRDLMNRMIPLLEAVEDSARAEEFRGALHGVPAPRGHPPRPRPIPPARHAH